MTVLTTDSQQKVEQHLIDDGLLTSQEIESSKQQAAKAGKPFLQFLLENRKITDEQLTKTLAGIDDVPYVNLSAAHINPQVLTLLPKDVAEHYMAVPLGTENNQLVVAMLDAGNVQAVDFLANRMGRSLKVYAASESGIRKVLKQYDQSIDKGVASMLESAAAALQADNGLTAGTAPNTSPKRVERKAQVIVEDSPVSKALSAIMDFAAKNRASDIHIEPSENDMKIRCRIDGVLREVMTLPKNTQAPLISRIKILANLKIDEHRIPQDGQFTISVDGKAIDLRIAISPTVWGEEVVIRLLDKSDTSFQLEDMGYFGRSLRLIRQGLKRPYGMVLTSGPTGSGKSTSMYAMIQEIKSESINIITLEDPVEYKIAGVNQIQINPDVGLTFATGLRAILRSDPNVVMVGEIRDKETANLAVQAALTGHLVFSTLHTNNAAGILPRLLDMGIEPFLIASTVHTVIGQRLVRRVVPGGPTYHSDPAETSAIKMALGNLLPKTQEQMPAVANDLGYKTLPLANQNAYTLVQGNPNPDNPTGYRGRIGLYEVFEVTEAIQDLIIKHATSSLIQRMAQSQGMVTMRQDGYLKALAGLTTLQEVNRVASADD